MPLEERIMAIYIYRKAASEGAVALAKAIGGIKTGRLPKQLLKQDIVICWGSTLQGVPCKVLNGAVLRSKLSDAKILRDAGVPTIEVSQDPKKGEDGWLPRIANHTGGLDLLHPPRVADFWVKKLDISREFRVHSFAGRSIRAGVKVTRKGFANPHPWIRSWDGGWRISYDGTSVKQKHRDVAHAAIKALGLDFGAVDIGECKGGALVVLEVNRAPGLEGGTIEAYVEAIKRWRKG
jgi:hypothetical protein